MAEKRGKGRASNRKNSDGDDAVGDDPASDRSLSEPQLARIRLRQRWELASVFNFLHVFKPLIQSDLKFSAEEIETALIKPNDALARIHIALLKGIPPVSKNITDADAWVTAVCKKLATWWPWVAEGENPLKADHGKEILRYKELDPTIRLLILKALCEVRAEQDDILRYITEELKKGTNVTIFRKEKMGGVDGITYWYDGDPIIGHRLYREIFNVETQQMAKGKQSATQPSIVSQWETVATDLEEFRGISEEMSSSKNIAEAGIGETIRLEIVPVLEEIQKKKERALKRQERQVLQLNSFLDTATTRAGITRTCRVRKPVSYTFEEYDRSINEALEISKKQKINKSHTDNSKQADHVSSQKDVISNGSKISEKENSDSDGIDENMAQNGSGDKYQGASTGSDEDGDDDYDEKDEDRDESNNGDGGGGDDDDADSDFTDPDPEKGASQRQTRPIAVRHHKGLKTDMARGLRRSQRTAGPAGHGEMKKRLRQRPTRNNAKESVQIISDSEDSLLENDKKTEIVSDTEMEASNASSDGVQVDSGDE